jgi:hypothetical protein
MQIPVVNTNNYVCVCKTKLDEVRKQAAPPWEEKEEEEERAGPQCVFNGRFGLPKPLAPTLMGTQATDFIH